MRATTELGALGGRLARSLLAASVAGVGVGLLDAWLAGRGEPTQPALASLANVGLIAPVALAVGLVTGLGAIVLDRHEPPSLSAWFTSLRARAVGRPADVAAFVPLTVLAGFLWMTLSAQLARALFGLEAAPELVGAAVAAGSVALGLVLALGTLTLTPPLRRALALACEKRRAYIDPVVTGGVALGLVVLLFAFGVATGGVSGEGGLFGIYGVFKRPELDLRAPAELLVVGLAGFFGQAILARPRAALALVLACAPLVLTVRAATALNLDPDVTLRLERGAPLGRIAITALRKLTDRDGDGVSGSFGGGDCDDDDPAINPFAEELADNGIDEDCSGADLSVGALPPPAPAEGAAPVQPASLIADDLDIVLITIDTLRADLGFMGYPRAVSPNLDALAKRATVFERGYALASYTGKSIGPMLIGKYGSETHRNWGHFNKFSDEDTFVAERLKRAGYTTWSVHGHRYFGAFGGLDRGFDKVDLSAAPPEGAAWDVDNLRTSDKLSDAAIELLASAKATDKLFLWVHYLDPHADYLKHADVPSFGTSQRDLYDGEIAFTDKHIGRVLDHIAQSPRAKRTAIIVTSDHGEAFGEHKMLRHGFELWEELVRVPLVVYVPSSQPSRVATRRSAIDVVPTILELAKAEPPSGAGSDFVSGVSLVADTFLDGKAAVLRDVIVDMPAGPYNEARRSFIHGDLKLTISGGTRFELYDLANDPDERRNLWRTDVGRAIEPIYAASKAKLREIKVTGKRK
jgi:arylsulfatase A-like enzyme